MHGGSHLTPERRPLAKRNCVDKRIGPYRSIPVEALYIFSTYPQTQCQHTSERVRHNARVAHHFDSALQITDASSAILAL